MVQQALKEQGIEKKPPFQEDLGGGYALPAVIVHAFCETAQTASLIQGLPRDRRFKNPSLSIFMGGLAAASQYYANEAPPNLILIETGLPQQEILTRLDALAQHCDENTKVVIIGRANDISLYRELMQRGVSEYLVPPLNPLAVIKCLGDLYADPETQSVGKVISFFSARGGCGSSTIAQNIGWYLSEINKIKCLVMDMDVFWGTSGLNFNKASKATLLDALLEPERVDEVMLERLMTRFSDHLSLLLTPASIKDIEKFDEAAYQNTIKISRSLSPFIILDIPHVWSDWSIKTLIDSEEIFIIATPDIPSLRNTKNILDYLRKERVNDALPKVILSQVGMPKKPEIPVKEFSNALNIQIDHIIPFDANTVGVAENSGNVLYNVAPNSKLVLSLERIATEISGKKPNSQKDKSGSLINKILKWK